MRLTIMWCIIDGFSNVYVLGSIQFVFYYFCDIGYTYLSSLLKQNRQKP